ncbi:MAG: FliM/FliN family flagellar motor switch protein [Limnochordales bacterium]|nr:FliM/FliN family flagellar motor switch protein [Limnochordales bacterium]
MSHEPALSAVELDTVREIGSIMMGASATSLSIMVNQWVNVTVPTASHMSWEELVSRYTTPCYLVRIQFEQGFRGVGQLVIAEADGRQLAQLLLGELAGEEKAADDLCLSALAEAMNQMMGAAATSLATLLDSPVSITPPRASLVSREDLLAELQAGLEAEQGLDQGAIVVFCHFHIGQGIMVEMALVLLPGLARRMVHNLWEKQGIAAAAGGEEPVQAAHATAGVTATPPPAEGTAQRPAADEGIPVAPQPSTASEEHGASGGQRPSPAEAAGLGNVSIDLIRHVPVDIAIRVGSVELPMDTISRLGPGAVLELDRAVWQPVEVLANGRVIAFGQLVTVNDHYAVQIRELATGVERLTAATQPATRRRRATANSREAMDR